jgi:hypothetical protein
VVNGVETVLASSVLPTLSMRPLLWLNVRFEAVPAGASSVLSGWVWADGSDSPPAPTLRAVDAAVELGGAGGVGGVGVHAYVSGSAVGPVTVLVDDVNVITR